MSRTQHGLQMDFKNHFFLTVMALVCLGIMAIKPGNSFRHQNEQRHCKHVKGKMECSLHGEEYKMNHSVRSMTIKSAED